MKTATTASKKSTTAAPRTQSPAASSKQKNAITLLSADHRTVEALFEEFENAKAASKKQKIAQSICDELTVHAAVEEQGFYPPVKEALKKDADLIAEATVEHASLKWLIAQILEESAESELYDAKMTVLKEYVTHHVKEEEKEMFPKVKKTDLDLVALGEELLALKEEFTAQLVKH